MPRISQLIRSSPGRIVGDSGIIRRDDIESTDVYFSISEAQFKIIDTGAAFGSSTLVFTRNLWPSLRPMARFRGTDFVYRSLGEIVHTVRTGEPGRSKALGMDGWEYLQKNSEMARVFDDAMTSFSSLVAPSIARAYDFSQWESIMDVGGGNGVLLAAILRAHSKLRGVLADQEHVLARARQRGFLGGELQSRSEMQSCDLFKNIPRGCRAYLMKSVIHDWNDKDALRILQTCRSVMPTNGALLLVEHHLPDNGEASRGNFIDILMMVVTGGKERTVPEYSALLHATGFRLSQVVPTSSGLDIIEARPASF